MVSRKPPPFQTCAQYYCKFRPRIRNDNLYAVADEESVGCPHLGPLAPAVPLRVLNPGKDRYFSFFAAMHFLTQACMPGTLPAHLASQAASDPCFAWGPAIAGVSDASTTIPQTIKARMCFLSNLKRYLSRLRPSNQCPPASRLDELSLAQINSHRCGAEIGRRQPVDRLPLGRVRSLRRWFGNRTKLLVGQPDTPPIKVRGHGLRQWRRVHRSPISPRRCARDKVRPFSLHSCLTPQPTSVAPP
jgi:hypothetical protein